MTQPNGFDEFPEDIRTMLEGVFARTGISASYMEFAVDTPDTCDFGENGEFQDMYWGTFSNVLRMLFLGGIFQKGISMASSMVASSDMNDFLAEGPLEQHAWQAYTHVHKHVDEALFSRIARDAIEPFVQALYDQGKYVPTGNEGDFVCIIAAEQAKKDEAAAAAEKPEVDGDN